VELASFACPKFDHNADGRDPAGKVPGEASAVLSTYPAEHRAQRAGLPDTLRFHDLRHTCAALLIAQGAHPKEIQERLGHSTIQLTFDCYGHLLPSLDERLRDGLDTTWRTVEDAQVQGGQLLELRR
jgi:integrase